MYQIHCNQQRGIQYKYFILYFLCYLIRSGYSQPIGPYVPIKMGYILHHGDLYAQKIQLESEMREEVANHVVVTGIKNLLSQRPAKKINTSSHFLQNFLDEVNYLQALSTQSVSRAEMGFWFLKYFNSGIGYQLSPHWSLEYNHIILCSQITLDVQQEEKQWISSISLMTDGQYHTFLSTPACIVKWRKPFNKNCYGYIQWGGWMTSNHHPFIRKRIDRMVANRSQSFQRFHLIPTALIGLGGQYQIFEKIQIDSSILLMKFQNLNVFVIWRLGLNIHL